MRLPFWIATSGLTGALVLGFGVIRAGGADVYVDHCAPGPGNGSQGNPFPTVNAGVSAAAPGSTLIIKHGCYNEVVNTPKSLVFNSTGGSILIGEGCVAEVEVCVPVIDQSQGAWQSPLFGRVDLTRIALAGHSTGGAAAVWAGRCLETGSCESLLQLDGLLPAALVLIAPASGAPDPPAAPTLVLYGTNECTCQVGTSPLEIYGDAPSPKHLIVTEGGNHFGYTDGICFEPPKDNPCAVGGQSGEEAHRLQRLSARNYVEAFLSYYVRGVASRHGFIVQQGGEQCGYPGDPPDCGPPLSQFSDLVANGVVVEICSCEP